MRPQVVFSSSIVDLESLSVLSNLEEEVPIAPRVSALSLIIELTSFRILQKRKHTRNFK